VKEQQKHIEIDKYIAQNKVSRLQKIILLIILIFISIAVFYLYRVNKISKIKNKNLKQLVDDKNLLLKEVHHRIKNNLQVINSLLNLQQNFNDSKSSKTVLLEVQNRINSMILVHDKLYKTADLDQINLCQYIEDLGNQLEYSLKTPDQNIQLKLQGDCDIKIGLDQLINCGLILNELITNCYKHAFNDCKTGIINININKSFENICSIEIIDNGLPFPKEIISKKSNTLGLILINGLIRQLKGKVQYDFVKKITKFEFPIKK